MNAGDVMRAVAYRVRDNVPVFTETTSGGSVSHVYYPALNHVPFSPCMMVRQSRANPTQYEKRRATLQIVRLNIELLILVATQEEKPREESKIDGIIEPVLDLFDAGSVGGNVNFGLTGLDESIDQVWSVATVTRTGLIWGSSGFCYAGIIGLDAQFSRSAQGVAP